MTGRDLHVAARPVSFLLKNSRNLKETVFFFAGSRYDKEKEKRQESEKTRRTLSA